MRKGVVGLVSFGIVLMVAVMSSVAVAQEEAETAVVKNAELYGSLRYQEALGRLSAMPEDVREMPTLFFTKWQHALLQEAREGYEGRPLDSESEKTSVVKGPREISLGGIVFSSKEQWTIWLNGKRITPDAIPREVMDLKVANDYIEIKWFDAFTNQIFPIRLRAHQRFNIDSRIFLPGAGVN